MYSTCQNSGKEHLDFVHSVFCVLCAVLTWFYWRTCLSSFWYDCLKSVYPLCSRFFPPTALGLVSPLLSLQHAGTYNNLLTTCQTSFDMLSCRDLSPILRCASRYSFWHVSYFYSGERTKFCSNDDLHCLKTSPLSNLREFRRPWDACCGQLF